MVRILILCTGNSCRSQMAEGILKSLDPQLSVYSAGTQPAEQVHPLVIQVMQEIGIDLSNARPKSVSQFLNMRFDYVITVCDNARETCPMFPGQVKHFVHLGFEDPARAKGPPADVLSTFRGIRDQIRQAFTAFYNTHLQPTNSPRNRT